MAVRILRIARLVRPSVAGHFRAGLPAPKEFPSFIRHFSTERDPRLQEPRNIGENQSEKDSSQSTAENHEQSSGSQGSQSPNDWSHEELLAEYTKLKELHTKAEEEVKSLKNKLAYALADIDNVRKVSRKDVMNARDFALKDFGKDLLDVVDNCERALSIFPEECKTKGHQLSSIYTGLEMTANVMLKVFDKHGLARIPIEAKKTIFDPNFHDALFQQPIPGCPPGVIFTVVKSGWTINGRVLRAAQVGVSEESEAEAAPETESSEKESK